MSGFIEGHDRRQPSLLPSCVDDYVDQDALVRIVDAFVGGLDLAGRVAVEREHCILPAHAVPIIAHLNEGTTSLLCRHPHVCGAGVERVLDQFLHRAGRALDDFSGGDLVGDGIGEDGYASGHGEV